MNGGGGGEEMQFNPLEYTIFKLQKTKGKEKILERATWGWGNSLLKENKNYSRSLVRDYADMKRME